MSHEIREIQKRLNAAKLLALDAGKLLMKFFGRIQQYDKKSTLSLVSQADKAVEEWLKNKIADQFPRDSILGEELGRSAGTNEFTWMLDPLDGTTNFVHAHPMFAVSIAVSLDSQLVASAIAIPFTKELFYAQKGKGAYLNDRLIKVSNQVKIANSLVATGLPYNRREVVDTILHDWKRAILNFQGIRRMGAAAVDLAYVSCGRYDGFWERGLQPWDTAAGALLVKEAGGAVTDFTGAEFDPFQPEIVASNGHIHQDLLHVLFAART